MCSWSSWGSRTSDSARGREHIATNERPVLTDPGCSGLCPTRSAPALLLNYPHSKTTFITSRKNHLILIYDHCLSFCHLSPQQRAWLSAFNNLHRYWGHQSVPWSRPFSRWNQPHSLRLSSQGRCSSLGCLGSSLLSSLLSSLQFADNLRVLGGQDSTWYPRYGQATAEQRGITASLHLLAVLLLTQPRALLAFVAARGLLAWAYPAVPQDPRALLQRAAPQPGNPSLFPVGCSSVPDTGQGICPGWISRVSCQLISPV